MFKCVQIETNFFRRATVRVAFSTYSLYFFSFCVYIVLRPRTVICFYDVIFKLFFHTQRKSWLTNVETLTEFVVTGVVLTVGFDIFLNGATKQQYCVHIYFLVSSVCG